MRLDGQTTSSKQKEIIQNFNTKPDHIIFLITSKAGGKGLNLTAASRVVLLDVAWNPTFDCKFNMKINFYHFDNRFIDLSIQHKAYSESTDMAKQKNVSSID